MLEKQSKIKSCLHAPLLLRLKSCRRMTEFTRPFFRLRQFWAMKNKAVKWVLVCLTCIGLIAGIAWAAQGCLHD